jgi:hypothetical protein
MTQNEFLDRYIQGAPGEWFFCIEIIWGHQISGGMFFRKQDARNLLLGKIVDFLDAPEDTLRPNRDKTHAEMKRVAGAK